MTTVHPNVYPLVKELEKRRGKDYEKQDLARRIGITRPTLDALIVESQKRERIEYRTIAKLLDFFRAEGMDITVADLFVVTTD